MSTAVITRDDLDVQAAVEPARPCETETETGGRCQRKAAWVVGGVCDNDCGWPTTFLLCDQHHEHAVNGRCRCSECLEPLYVTWSEAL
jgi:hypothetical protein